MNVLRTGPRGRGGIGGPSREPPFEARTCRARSLPFRPAPSAVRGTCRERRPLQWSRECFQVRNLVSATTRKASSSLPPRVSLPISDFREKAENRRSVAVSVTVISGLRSLGLPSGAFALRPAVPGTSRGHSACCKAAGAETQREFGSWTPRDPGHPGASAAEPEGAVAAGGGLQPPGLLGCPASFSGWA